MNRNAIVLMILLSCAAQLYFAANVGGRWEGTFTVTDSTPCSGESGPWSAYLVDREGVVTGTYDSVVSGSVSGTSQGDNVRWTIGGSGGATISGTITGTSFRGTFTNGEDCFGFGSTSGTVLGSKISGAEGTGETQQESTEQNNTQTTTVPFITAPTDTISQESMKQMVLQSGTDLLEARKLREMQTAIVQASTMANNGASTEEVSDVLSNAGVMSNNYLNINEVVANPTSGEQLLSATELARRVRDGMSETIDSNQAKADSLEQQVISRYQELLKSDPTNFWANYDMATITRSKGESSAAYMYYLKAAEGISDPETAKAFKEQAAVKTKQAFKLTEMPTPAKSSFISQLGSDANAWINDKGTKLFQKLLTPDQAKVILCIVNSDVNTNLLDITTG